MGGWSKTKLEWGWSICCEGQLWFKTKFTTSGSTHYTARACCSTKFTSRDAEQETEYTTRTTTWDASFWTPCYFIVRG